MWISISRDRQTFLESAPCDCCRRKSFGSPASGGVAQGPTKDSNSPAWVDLKKLNRIGPHMRKLMSVCRVKSLGVQACVFIFYLATTLKGWIIMCLCAPAGCQKERKRAIISAFWINPSKAQMTRESSFMLFCTEKSFSNVLACWDPSAHLPLNQLRPSSGSQFQQSGGVNGCGWMD